MVALPHGRHEFTLYTIILFIARSTQSFYTDHGAIGSRYQRRNCYSEYAVFRHMSPAKFYGTQILSLYQKIKFKYSLIKFLLLFLKNRFHSIDFKKRKNKTTIFQKIFVHIFV